MSETIQVEINGSAARVWMDRGSAHNALTDALIGDLTATFETLGQDRSVRVIVLCGRGKSFSAGADIEMMKRLGAASEEENLDSARRLALMFHAIASCTKPTVARVHGSAIGGGLGLVSVCDIAIAANTAVFATSEVRLGLIPATIAPYVVRAIGSRAARRLFQTGERIDAVRADHLGLISEVVDSTALDDRVNAVIENIIAGAPDAQRQSKELIDMVAGRPMTLELIEQTAQWIASIRSGPEAREGLAAFLEKRTPAWASREDT